MMLKRKLVWWLLVVLIVAGCSSRAGGMIALSAAEFDFGTVPNTKTVSETFDIRNEGRGTLEISRISTSCGCTTAEVADVIIAPGESTELTVMYDPQAHGGATGRFMRVVYIRSTDPKTPETQLTVFVNVVEP